MKYIEAAKLLQSTGTKLNPTHALINFHSMICQGYVPEGASSIQDLVEAKNTLLRSWVHSQVVRKGHFSIRVPFDSPCTKCRGTGEIYKLQRFEEKTKDCPTCEGNGWFWKLCNDCKGTAEPECKCLRHKDEWPDKQQGLVKVKCRECRSFKHKKRFVGLESTTKCHACKGFGFKYQHSQRVTNPVFPVSKLEDIITQTEPEPQPEASDQVDLEAQPAPDEVVDQIADNSGVKLEETDGQPEVEEEQKPDEQPPKEE